jgi:hypothetical protein
MEAHAKFDIKKAFVLKSEDIAKIWKIFEDNGMEVIATITCSDDFVRKFEKYEKIIQYENAKRSSIIKLDIEGRCNNPYTRAEISFGYLDLKPLHVSIRGDENLVLPMRIRIGDILHGIKPWYSCIATMDFLNIIFPILIFLWTLLSLMSSGESKTAMSFDKALINSTVVISVLCLIGISCWGISWLRKYLFPIHTFAIGQGLERHNFNENLRRTGVSFFVGLPILIFKLMS